MISVPFIIDGHNLIPKIPGLSLQRVDDELQLIHLLQDFCRRQRKTAEVYFDNAPPGYASVQKLGRLKVHYIRQGSSADQAIRGQLVKLGRTAANWIVVSSDREVQAAAKIAGARQITAEAFSGMLQRVLWDNRDEEAGRSISANEVAEWLVLFENPDGRKEDKLNK